MMTHNSRKDIMMINRRTELLNILVEKYGKESEPTLYFAKWATEDIYNMDIYFSTAINWIFMEW